MDERARACDQTIEKLRHELARAETIRREYDEPDPKAPYKVPVRTSDRFGDAQQTSRGNGVTAPPEQPSISKRLSDLRDAVAGVNQLAETLEQRLDCVLTPLDAPLPKSTADSGPGGYRLIADDIGATTHDVLEAVNRLERIHRRINL